MTKQQALEEALTMIRKSQTIYCVLRTDEINIDRISLYIIKPGSILESIDEIAAIILDKRISHEGGIICQGYKMDGKLLTTLFSYALGPTVSGTLNFVYI